MNFKSIEVLNKDRYHLTATEKKYILIVLNKNDKNILNHWIFVNRKDFKIITENDPNLFTVVMAHGKKGSREYYESNVKIKAK